MSSIYLSDNHNFGQKVQRLDNGRIHKPRSLFWERILLSNSEFRNAIESLKGLDFSLPVLDFSIDSSWSGTVENLCLDEVDVLAPEDGFAVGCTMALFAWLGISDLHRENLKIGFRVLQLARALVRVNNRQDFEEQFGETKVSVEGQQLFFVSGGLKLKCNWT